MNRLSPRHRLAHLRALIRCEPDGTNRHELVALLRDQLATLHANENRTIRAEWPEQRIPPARPAPSLRPMSRDGRRNQCERPDLPIRISILAKGVIHHVTGKTQQGVQIGKGS
jgi:hypothetical protein